jgi:Recombinase zinc beta ribbon domain
MKATKDTDPPTSSTTGISAIRREELFGGRCASICAADRSANYGPKFLLWSLMRCGHCGSSYAIAGRDVYTCSDHTNGGNALCRNEARLRRRMAEFELLAGIKRELRSPRAGTSAVGRRIVIEYKLRVVVCYVIPVNRGATVKARCVGVSSR